MMWRQSIKQCLLILLVLGLAACKKYTIVDPVNDSLHTTPPPTYRVTYTAQPATMPAMTLNGFAVGSNFTAGATEATAQGSALEAYLKEGYNVFQVDPPLGPQVKFIYDTKGPGVVVLGAVIDGSNITIDGKAIDERGVSSGNVNGFPIQFGADGSFRVTVPKADIYTYNMADTLGHTSTIHYADLNQQYDPSMTVQITQEGLNFATKQVVNALNGADLNALVAGSMLYDSTWKGVFGETYGADGFVRTISMSANDFSLGLEPGAQANFDGDISNIHVGLTLRLHNGFLPPTVINVGATVGPLQLGGKLQLGVQDQAPTVSISNFSYNIGAIVIDDVPPVFREILSGVTSGIANLLSGPISSALQNILNDAIPKMLSSLIMDSYTLRIADGQSNFDMAMALNLTTISTTSNTLYAAMAGSVLPINPNMNIPQPLAGTLFTFDELPPAELNGNQFAASLNSNVINQTLASAHSVGLTHMNMVGDKVQFGLPRDDNFGDPEDTMRILVNLGAPANLKVKDVNGRAEPTLSVYGLEIHGQSKKNGATVFTNDISVRVNAEVGISLGLGANNMFDVQLRQAPIFQITGFHLGDKPWSGPVVNAAANKLVSEAIGMVMKELSKPIENIKLPTFACMAFDSVDITAVGGEGGHLNVAGTLTKVSDECDNPVTPPPKVAYGRGVGVPMSCASDQEYDAGLCYQQCAEGYDGVGPVCWKQNASYGRGVGTIPNLCAAGEEMDAGLCYPVCAQGYDGVGPVCWSTRPLSYGRGAGTIPINIWTGACPSGKENQAGLCYWYCDSGYHGVGPVCWLDNASYGRGVGTIPKTCPAGQENDAGLCYPVCSPGYHGVGPVCWTNDALSYGRGVGTVPNTCHTGWEKNGLLCYPQCEAGYNGVGPVCWPAE